MLFVFVSNLAVMNMLIGVICQVSQDVSTIEKEQSEEAALKESLFHLLDCFNVDDDMTLTQDQFEPVLKNPEIWSLLMKHGVEPTEVLGLEDRIFQGKTLIGGGTAATLPDGSRTVSFRELVAVIVRLRKGTSASVSDVAEIRQHLVDLKKFLRKRFDRLTLGLTPASPASTHPRML